MAEDCVDHAVTLGLLEEKPCVTRNLHIHGYCEDADTLGSLAVYGSDAAAIQSLAASEPSLAAALDPALPYIGAEVVWAARQEMARTVDDVISRRTRALFLNARAAQRMIEPVAALLARELGRDENWRREQIKSANTLAAKYLVP
jgi:glycerol-3-phosphate dehydrogenase